MTTPHRVIWLQGIFLQPHHFQQEARFVESLIDARVRAAHQYGWGFGDLVLDEAQLALGRVALLRGQRRAARRHPVRHPRRRRAAAAVRGAA